MVQSQDNFRFYLIDLAFSQRVPYGDGIIVRKLKKQNSCAAGKICNYETDVFT